MSILSIIFFKNRLLAQNLKKIWGSKIFEQLQQCDAMKKTKKQSGKVKIHLKCYGMEHCDDW